jgi:WD40 repeat protein
VCIRRSAIGGGTPGGRRSRRYVRRHDGARVVTASWDNTARVWDAGTGKHRQA